MVLAWVVPESGKVLDKSEVQVPLMPTQLDEGCWFGMKTGAVALLLMFAEEDGGKAWYVMFCTCVCW